jgi:hypothetical protein
MELKLKRRVELYQSKKTAWHMLFLPKGLSRDLRKFFEGATGGFGSLPVEATVGKTTWRTSIFPESKDGAFLMLIKAEVRKKENIKAGDLLSLTLKILI